MSVEVRNSREYLENADATSGTTGIASVGFVNRTWNHRRRLERYLLIALPILVLTIAGLSIALGIINAQYQDSLALIENQNGQKTTADEYCLTTDCVLTASRLLDSLDETADPCDNFFQFACGGWNNKHPIPDSEANWDQFSELRLQLSNALRDILERASTPSDPAPLQQAKILYNACIDTDKLEQLGLAPLQDTLTSLVEEGNWQNATARSRRRFLINRVVYIAVDLDDMNTNQSVIYIDQPDLGLSRSYLDNPDAFRMQIETYKTYLSSVLGDIQHPPLWTNKTTSQVVQDIVDFEIKLASIMTPNEARRNKTRMYNPMSVTALQILMDEGGVGSNPENIIDWASFLEALFADANVHFDATNGNVVIREVQFIQKLAQLLSNTSKETLDQYVAAQLMASLAPETTTAMRDYYFRFRQQIYGIQAQEPRSLICSNRANVHMGMAISYDYVQNYFNLSSKAEMDQMVQDIRDAFKELVNEVDWMDDVTKKATLQKVDAVRSFIGYPDWLLDVPKLEAYYAGLEPMNISAHLENVELASTWTSSTEFERLNTETDRTRWVTDPTVVNAFYSASYNSISFPAGILHPPFFGLGLQSLNYASSGMVSGHELTHGFDDRGRQNDLNGNLHQWWTEETIGHYQERAQCFVEQYNHFVVTQTYPNLTLNGMNTLGENIADNGGLREAIRAYNISRSVLGPDPMLPGLEKYTSEQLFFIAFANVWCGTFTDAALENQVLNGVHSPGQFRIHGPVSNSPEFSSAWGCEMGTPMNPQVKCKLW